MNWLLYLGGGYMWLGLWWGFIDIIEDSIGKLLYFLASVLVWIWICWKVSAF